MADPSERQRERELAIRRENELKDLETEADHSERPLEGLSSAHTSWTGDQPEAPRTEHADDERRSREASEAQVPPAPPDRTLPPADEEP
jgi:hypothetical protein